MSHFKTWFMAVMIVTGHTSLAANVKPCVTGQLDGQVGRCEAPTPKQDDLPSAAVPAASTNAASPAGVKETPEQAMARKQAVEQAQAATTQADAEKLAVQKAQEFEQNRAEMVRNEATMSALQNGFSGGFLPRINEAGDYVNNGPWSSVYQLKKPSTCNAPVNQTMLKNFHTCLSQKSSVVKTYKSLVMDAESRIGYVVSADGDILDCYTITVGSGGIGNATRSGTRQTETGFFYSQFHNGDKYQTNNPNYERKSIGIGEPNGKVLHSDHQNRSTWGCIGIEQAKWKRIFDMMSGQGWGAPIYVWTARSNSCQPSPGSNAATPSRPAINRPGVQ